MSSPSRAASAAPPPGPHPQAFLSMLNSEDLARIRQPHSSLYEQVSVNNAGLSKIAFGQVQASMDASMEPKNKASFKNFLEVGSN